MYNLIVEFYILDGRSGRMNFLKSFLFPILPIRNDSTRLVVHQTPSDNPKK